MSKHLNIQNWAAIAGDLQSKEQWISWAQAPHFPTASETFETHFIPKNMKRRCSLLSKMALEASIKISKDGLPQYSVFASRHGEIGRTLDLLDSIKKREALSPIGFSQSVHNTASGLYTIIHGARIKSTSLSAGPQTLKMAFLDGLNYLSRNPDDTVQVTVFDQALPKHYQKNLPSKTHNFAVSVLVTLGDPTPEPQDTSPPPIEGSDFDFANYPELRLIQCLGSHSHPFSISWEQLTEIL